MKRQIIRKALLGIRLFIEFILLFIETLGQLNRLNFAEFNLTPKFSYCHYILQFIHFQVCFFVSKKIKINLS